ncbi:MAG: hypothetical protein ACK6CO_05765 [Cyanobacteriota bacterium]
MTSSSCSPFIPAGSYQESLSANTVIQVTLTATCKNESGGSNQSTLTFNSGALSGINDISNDNGNLTLESGSGSPINTENPYVPAGSYQDSSSDIQITLSANCRNEKGDGVNSSITYSEADAKKFSGIENNNGQLESTTSNSISLSTVSESDEGDDDDGDGDGDDGDGSADGGDDAGAEAGGDAGADAGGDAAAAGGADAAGDTAAAAGGADAAADASAAAAACCA